MSIAITSWLRAYFALQQDAIDARGCVEIAGDDDEVIRWPRTRGSDVIAIATMLATYPGETPWRDAVADIARVNPDDEYADNRAFWQALLAHCVDLHAQATPLPSPETWRAVFRQLATKDTHVYESS